MSGKARRRRYGWGVAVGILLALAVGAHAQWANQVPNPRSAGVWVSDTAGVVDAATETRLNQLIADLERRTGVEIAVVTLSSVGDDTPKEVATELFNRWGVGKRERDNGVLVLLVMDARRVEVETGYGVEGVLPDGKVGELLRTYAVPRFRQGDFGGGLLALVRSMASVLEGAGAEVRGGSRTTHRSRGGSLAPLGWGAAVGILFLIGVGYGVWRRSIRRCPQCGKRMRLLSKEQEKAYLAEDQRFEEELGAVNWKVWRCDDCQVHEIQRGWRSWAFSDCPKCGHHTVHTASTVVRAPTYVSTGLREEIQTCMFPRCSYRTKQHRVIPRRERRSSGPWVVGGGWSGGGGGGFGGGSFGGGSSGGGGAGASW
ncbi:MAG: TPM domain-containing protein [Armatimonadota bacterium]|nr:TPM domain-containing protein [Armatimonadota bacterium]